jgi:FKBP-type peptidyl-prolyl cis-trans isomerase FkpA
MIHYKTVARSVHKENSMSAWRLGMPACLVALALSGCEDPGEIVPVAPPGAVIPRQSPDTEPFAAQGEMVAPLTPPKKDAAKPEDYTPAPPTAKGETKTTAHGVKYETLREGSGPELIPGQTARVHYVGTLENGKEFYSSRKSSEPEAFNIKAGTLIKGWVEALPGMKVGEVRKLTIPPDQAYGERGKPPEIPPNATLTFEIELVDIL